MDKYFGEVPPILTPPFNLHSVHKEMLVQRYHNMFVVLLACLGQINVNNNKLTKDNISPPLT